ncbi:helix-turn-helix transcriptional regulator [Spirosoma utsteinense]|uniref:DNA-binding transcriptional regulator YafY n=1 Tax=Spirosoma utsteinense TaxID=2585773 RepID=A0ABR6WAB4_9BACT|nr:WYL domain-containing protein [Spirosoma utsteinense]MBC3787211.1 putative DNA-binding transcriptional regulator YafY [Spirosoma utsteinense]MBC3792896.1 putative DNA-binding transcriptional regulator YafY [Spirosoma utsteinense]
MPANRNALVRYKTLDACLRNRQRNWTLDDLIGKVSEALYEYEGLDKGISRRTVQADLQMMRSDKLGYFAPIVVIAKKYYTYEDPAYSITNIPLSDGNLSRMNEAVEVLKQFKGFSHFTALNEVVQKLEDHVYSTARKSAPVIDFEKNESLKGLHYLEELYQAVVQQRVLLIDYQSFSARLPQTYTFHVWWLKEFKNRWFAVGVCTGKRYTMNLALDRMLSITAAPDLDYIANDNLDPDVYYRDVIGVSVSEGMRPVKVRLFVSQLHAPYVETKPLHHSQQVVERTPEGIFIQLTVQHNFELEKEILGFGEGVQVLEPERLRRVIVNRLKAGMDAYLAAEAAPSVPDQS